MKREVESAPFERSRTFRWALLPVMRAMSRYHRARVFGVSNIPSDTPVVYVGKHPRTVWYFETMVLGLHAFWRDGRPPIRVLETRNTAVHRAPLLGWMRRHVSAIPADRENAFAALERGESLLIFPGGARELRGPPDQLRWSGRTGFARLAMQFRVPIVPFAIIGADQQHVTRIAVGRSSVWLPPVPLPVRLDFHFGTPIPSPPTFTSRHAVEAHAACVEEATRALIAAGWAARQQPRRPGGVPLRTEACQ